MTSSRALNIIYARAHAICPGFCPKLRYQRSHCHVALITVPSAWRDRQLNAEPAGLVVHSSAHSWGADALTVSLGLTGDCVPQSASRDKAILVSLVEVGSSAGGAKLLSALSPTLPAD